MAIFNYEAFTEVLEKLLIPLNNYAHSIGYMFDLKEQVLLIVEKCMPVFAVWMFLTELSKKNFRDKMQSLYGTITNWQLILCSVALPLLLFCQNRFLAHLSLHELFKEKE